MYEGEGHFPYFDRDDEGVGCTGAVLQSNFSVPAGLFGTTLGTGTTTDHKAAGFRMAGDAVLECATLSMDFGGGGLGTVSIWSGSVLPTTRIATLNSPPQDGVGDFTFHAPTPVALAAGETYWLYVEAIEEPGGTFRWRGTNPNTLPTGGASHVGYVFNGASSTTYNRFELTAEVGHPADLNGDGTVDVLDLLELLAAWGPV